MSPHSGTDDKVLQSLMNIFERRFKNVPDDDGECSIDEPTAVSEVVAETKLGATEVTVSINNLVLEDIIHRTSNNELTFHEFLG